MPLTSRAGWALGLEIPAGMYFDLFESWPWMTEVEWMCSISLTRLRFSLTLTGLRFSSFGTMALTLLSDLRPLPAPLQCVHWHLTLSSFMYSQ